MGDLFSGKFPTMSSEEIQERSKRRRILRELPIDVVEEILLRLPLKHVFRCKLLSKAYYELIKSPSFINEHSLHQSRNANIAVMVKRPDHYKYHTLILEPPNYTKRSFVYKPAGGSSLGNHTKVVVGSCNGLLCLHITLIKSRHQSYALWNPTTGESFEIHKPIHVNHYYSYTDVVGFGYEAVEDRTSRGGGSNYKLVKIADYLPSYGGYMIRPEYFSASVWSISTNKWKEIGSVLPGLLLTKKHRFDAAGLFINGSLYWLAHSISKSVGNAVLVSYSMNDDTFREVSMPDDVLVRWKEYDIVVNDFMGSLALFVPFPGPNGLDKVYDVWVMTTDPKITSYWWTKRFSIGPIGTMEMPTRVSIGGNFLMETLRAPQDRYHFFDPRRNEKLETEHAYPVPCKGATPWCFTQSLVPIK